MSTQAPSQECPPKPNVRTDDRARFVCQPNSLGYQDENGIERNIRLPPGTVEIAWDHAVNKRWEELAKYETIRSPGHSEQAVGPAGHQSIQDKKNERQ